MAKNVPFTGGEKESLHASLDGHRDAVLWKLDGLDDEQLRRPMTPSGTNLLGLVKHLAVVEYGWFCQTFGREVEPFLFDPEDEGANSSTVPPATTLRADPDRPWKWASWSRHGRSGGPSARRRP